jgi:putative ABC transport system permease protein
LENEINEGPTAQAVLPVREIFLLFDMFVRPAQMLLLLMSVLICIVSGVSILVSIYNSMSERRHEIAVMRALGAERQTVMAVILWEATILGAAAGRSAGCWGTA